MSRGASALLTIAVAALAGCHGDRAVEPPDAARLGEAAATHAATGPGPDAGVAVAPGAATAAARVPLSPTVRVSIRSIPRAAVAWGRKRLGTTPLAVTRPRDSGPMDLVLHANGYLPLHTRAYTFRDDALSVELVREEDRDTLLGARKAPPPDAAVVEP